MEFIKFASVDWRLDPLNRKFSGGNLIDIAATAPIKIVKFEDICRLDEFIPSTMKRECCRCCNGERYFYADITKPCIILRTDRNPLPKPYRLLDGTHRFWAMQAKGWTEGPFKILTMDCIKPYLKIKTPDLTAINLPSFHHK
tara:strand:- start:991 stop:1416 length:426 start_codon:yes stop_codon:yes gene_type:complete